MADLKLAKLPDRTPVKLAIMLSPDVHRALADYSELYAERYGQRETITDLIPAIIANFLESDRAFAKGRNTPSSRS